VTAGEGIGCRQTARVGNYLNAATNHALCGLHSSANDSRGPTHRPELLDGSLLDNTYCSWQTSGPTS
jgi:hypothetical protein